MAISKADRARAARSLASGNDAAFTLGRSDSTDSAGTPRIVAIPNGVPVPESLAAPAGLAGSAARDLRRPPGTEKGLDTLVDAWPSVRARYPRRRLILIGEGPQRPVLEEGQGSWHDARAGPGGRDARHRA